MKWNNEAFAVAFHQFTSSHVRKIIVIAFILCAGILFATCMNTADPVQQVIQLPNGNQLVGSIACKECHADTYTKFQQTAHSKTSNPPEKEFVKGSFDRSNNAYLFNYRDRVFMAEMKEGLFQVNFVNEKYDTAYRFGMVVGSGTRGQTYLYWRGPRLFQLPISYMSSTASWCNSPGYPDSKAIFSRPVGSQCLGCHSSYAKIISERKELFEKFDSSSIVYGVNCERCHGPGGRHVEFYKENPTSKEKRFIINASKLSQRQQLDACAVCHSSITTDLKPALGFETGDTLYHKSSHELDSVPTLDVHGNQYGLLIASKCFKSSQAITCSTCHNPHNQERDNLPLFASKCVNCHNAPTQKHCKLLYQLTSQQLINNCINCHMPTKASEILDVKLAYDVKHTPALIRTHFISIYPERSLKIYDSIKAE